MLETIAENAAKVTESEDAVIYHVDGDALRRAAKYGPLRGDQSERSAKRLVVARLRGGPLLTARLCICRIWKQKDLKANFQTQEDEFSMALDRVWLLRSLGKVCRSVS